MTSAISIHIGLNHVDPNAYDGWDGQLAACVNDALSMQRIADSLGYVSTVILNEEATADRVIAEIGQAAWNLSPDGILLVTYSGHGGQMPDNNGDESDGQDETWVLYDRQMIDDELDNLWSQFGLGTRIVVLSDSCHSGTVTKSKEYQMLAQSTIYASRYRTRSGPPRFKAIPAAVAAANYQQHASQYRALQFASGSRTRGVGDATVLLISGCQDNQLSSDGDINGLFTGTLLSIWANGGFTGSYESFQQAIVNQMPATQSPNYYVTGASNPGFEAQRPFTVEAPNGGGSNGNSDGGSSDGGSSDGGNSDGSNGSGSSAMWPTITGPTMISRFDGPPHFTVNAGPGRFFIVEVATQSDLFNADNFGNRSADNFYGSWSDTSLLQGTSYDLPSYVWENFQAANRLFYRLGSATDANYSNYQVTNSDSDGDLIPAIEIE